MDTHSLVLHTLTFRNFLSFGDAVHILHMDGKLLSVILGENYDTGGEDSRNGTGKSAIIDALSYVLFGKSVRGVTLPKLVNKIVGKRMIVTLEFTKGEFDFRIERGIAPDHLILYRKPKGNNDAWDKKEKGKYCYDISKKSGTGDAIEEILGFDFVLFELLVANSSESIPFLKLGEEKKREIIEKLFGFTVLSKRAEILKDDRKDKKTELVAKESALVATKQANDRVTKQIIDLESRARNWDISKTDAIQELEEVIQNIKNADLESDIEVLTAISTIKTQLADLANQKKLEQSKLRTVQIEYSQTTSTVEAAEKKIISLQQHIDSINASVCPTCAQHWVPDGQVVEDLVTHQTGFHSTIASLDKPAKAQKKAIGTHQKTLESLDGQIKECNDALAELATVEITYEDIDAAKDAKNTLVVLERDLKDRKDSTNPHLESIENLKTEAVVEIDMSAVDDLKLLIEHYDYLINLLTKKDSFIRKTLIDRSLPYLNKRVSTYLKTLQLPHKVMFNTDLSVDISQLHEEYDYGNLSKGERLRLTLAMNFAIQDCFEFMYYKINALMIDELLDAGMDPRGAENCVSILKDFAEAKDKRVFLITHREDIASRVDDIIRVRKEDGFSKILTNR